MGAESHLTAGLRSRLFVFALLFSSGMWMSKVAQPLYFDRHEALPTFAIGYAVMAAAGGASFLLGRFVDRFGGAVAVRFGALIYALGIAGRVSTDLVPVIGSSLLAGVGASLVLVSMRSWMRSALLDEASTTRLVATRSLGNQFGIVVGTVGAALLFSAAPSSGHGEMLALLIAAGLVGLGLAWLLIGREANSAARPTSSKGEDDDVPSLSRSTTFFVASRLCLVAAISGFYVSLVTPYVPLILTRGGLAASTAALVVGLMSALQIVVTFVLGRRTMGAHPRRHFALTEGFTGIATLAVMAVLDSDGLIVAVVMILRAGFVAAAVIFEETLQLSAVPAASAGLIFGAAQSAFLVGDVAGGAAGAALISAGGTALMLLVSGAITLANAALAPLLLGQVRRRSDAMA